MKELRKNIVSRDSIMAYNVINKFNEIRTSNAKRKKALVIMNFRHAFRPEFIFPDGRKLRNTTYYLLKEFGNKTANVFLNSVVYTANGTELVQHGNWDAAFQYLHEESIGFDFAGTPFGKDSFDIWPIKSNFLYQNVFTGFVFYLPIEKHFMVEGTRDLMDSAFKMEALQRAEKIAGLGGELSTKKQNIIDAITHEAVPLNIEEERHYYQLEKILAQRDSVVAKVQKK